MSARLRLPARLPDLFTDDRTLLGRFIERRDDAAFASIVKRHGGFVLGVCRRVLRDASLAEDAFQAVFLVLAKNPQAAANATSISAWLFGTARRVSLAARRGELRRVKREQRAAAKAPSEPCAEWDDLLLAVDEELARLPEENRAALIACFLREQTQDEAARELGWSLSTLRRRLERGKELLKARLTRRGATLAAGMFAGVFAPSNAVAVPLELAAKAGDASACSPAALKLASAKSFPTLPLLAGLVVAAVAAGSLVPRAEVEARPANVIATAAPAPKPEWVAFSGQVTYPAAREIPERREITKNDLFVKDAECCFQDGRRLFLDELVIDAKTRGLANAVVWLRPDLENRDPAFPENKILRKHEAKERAVEVKDCQFTPRITLARPGDTIRFKNPAPLATNVRYDSTARGPGAKFGQFNVLLAANTGDYTATETLQRGRVADMFQSSIHTWMRGFVWCFDHPYAAVTDAEGKFSIPNAPVGTWRLVIWHEKYGFSGGAYAGRKVTFEKDTVFDPIPFAIVQK